MSRDLFVQDLPVGITDISEIPCDFEPKPIGPRSVVISTICSIAPDADFSDPSWGRIVRTPELFIEINLGENEELQGFAFHVSGGVQAEILITNILAKLGLRALDPSSETGLFEFHHA